MKALFGTRLILPVMALLLALPLACRQAGDATPTPEPASPLASSASAAKPLTGNERESIAGFVQQQQAVDEKRASLYQEFDDWRSGLTECHPSAAQEALQEFAASFKSVTGQARGLPRKTSTKELADLLIPAVEAEEAAFRALRDRWQPGNVSLFETVERKRAEAARAREATEDRSLELQEGFEEGPTTHEIRQTEEFSQVFEEIEDAWNDYHDAYDGLSRKEANLNIDELFVGYAFLAELLGEIIETLSELEPTDHTGDFIETLLEPAEAELDALSGLTGALTASAADAAPDPGMEGETEMPTPGPTGEPEGITEKSGVDGPMEDSAAMESGETGAPAGFPPEKPVEEALPALQQELAAAVEGSKATLEEVGHSIEVIVEDKSAEYLADVQDFNDAYGRLVRNWKSFHEGYDAWRKTGGCDRVETLRELDGFSRRAGEISGEVRGLPRTGFLLPAYSLLVEAAEREEGAMRALYNSWRPFTVDAFVAVDQERANAARLRQQANTALQELQSRP